MTRLDILVQHGRALEWLTSGVLLAFAIVLAIPGDTLAVTPAFRPLSDLGADDAMVSSMLLTVAIMRMTALYINGAWRRTPRLRMWGAIASAPLFLIFSLTAMVSFAAGDQPALSTGAGTYLVLFFFEVLAAYRSSADAAHKTRTA